MLTMSQLLIALTVVSLITLSTGVALKDRVDANGNPVHARVTHEQDIKSVDDAIYEFMK